MIDRDIYFFRHYLAELMLEDAALITPITGGKNSRVYHVICKNSREFAVKIYFRDKMDSRERLRTEWQASQFMVQQGFQNIPKPMVKDETYDVAVYEYIQGVKLSNAQIEIQSIHELVSFLTRLEQGKKLPEATPLPPASEACFSIVDVIETIVSRLNRFMEGRTCPYGEKELMSFINTLLIPFFQEVRGWCYHQVDALHWDLNQKIEKKDQTISPSDFGFHNALLAKSGVLYFLDFEYFGWDDPAKMIVDFLLHPAMELRTELKHYFLEQMLAKFAHIHGIKPRIKIVYPLFGIKWCLILLNEFLPCDNKRRALADASLHRKDTVLQLQLQKAHQMYRFVKDTYKEFYDA